MYFSAFGLQAPLLKALEQAGLTTPTPVQAQAIPAALQGRDVLACAQTGTGKTAAFVLPALHRIISGPSAQPKGRGPRVLVLTPTRELAQQVTDNVRTFGREARLRSGVIVGGVSYGPQYTLLANPLDMLVATPGRLIDHMQEGKVDFSRVEMVVLDEADKMLDMGFLKPVERILEKIRAATSRPQMLLFSATFTPAVDKFSQRVLHQPTKIELAPARANHDQITQHVFRADGQDHKLALLHALLKNDGVTQAIIFSATKHGSEKLAGKLSQAGYASAALHGGMKQNARKRTLAQMHGGSVRFLVATDVAARGIDVKQLSHVINFDLPQVAEDYVHRIGRTGRAGETGVAISLVAPSDVPMLRDIEKLLGKRMDLAHMPGLEPALESGEFERQGAAAPRSRKGQGRPGGQVGGRGPAGPRGSGRPGGAQDSRPRRFGMRAGR
jgi:superfamily II DNA/RNA helicase